MKSWITTFIAAALLVLGLTVPAGATLTALGPINPQNGMPLWLQDSNGVAVDLCLTPPALIGPCAFTAPTTDPYSIQVGFGAEAFYFLCNNKMTLGTGGRFLYVAAVEAGFLPAAPILNGNQIVFTRIRFTMDAPVAGTYTITHPYGVDTFNVTTPGVRSLLFTRDHIALPPTFSTILASPDCTPFMKSVSAPPGTLGDARIVDLATGSPFGTNFVKIVGPAGSGIGGPGVDTIQNNLFSIAGHLTAISAPTPLTITKAVHTRNALGAGSIDIFAKSLPTAVLTANIATTPLPTTITMTGDALGNFLGHAQFAGGTAIPATVSVTADNSATNPGALITTLTAPNTDIVTVTTANYDVNAAGLRVNATTSDLADISPLTLVGFGAMVPTATPGTFTRFPGMAAPPVSVTVTSADGGSGTLPVTVIQPPPGTPIAVADAFSTPAGVPTGAFDVTLNDTIPNGLAVVNPVVVITPPLNGTLVPPTGSTSMNYTPNLGFSGIDKFTYRVHDALGLISTLGTVTITVVPADAPPIANPDAATTAPTIPVVINVLANDTDVDLTKINPASVLISTAPLHGTATVNALTGAITYTGVAGNLTLDTIRYTVADTAGLRSLPGTVTVTLADARPVANPDTATAGALPVVINVLANDTDVDATKIDPTSVHTTQPLHGTAVVNLTTGTITYTRAAGFAGIDTFLYNVADTAALRSPTATVTVTVVGPPVAANDTAGANLSVPTVINVLANDTAPGSTLNAASVTIVSPPTGGTATVNANGTVTFTGTRNGVVTFTYNVKNALGTVSNTATVTVTVATLKIGSAKFTTATNTWLITGNCITPGVTITAHAGSTNAGATIGSAPVAAAGTWSISVPGSLVPSSATVSVISSQGVEVLAFPVLIK